MAQPRAARRRTRGVAVSARGFRCGQRALAESVFNAARSAVACWPRRHGHRQDHRDAVPMLKACPGQELDKVFFLTAKGSGRSLALDALKTMAPA